MATEKRLDLVEREAIKDAIGFMNLHFLGHGENKSVLDSINEVPSVDAVEVVHGRWIGYHEADIGYDEYGVRCSNCNFEVEDHEVDFIMNYCPNCGASMKDGDGNGSA